VEYVRRPYKVTAFQHDGSQSSAQALAAWTQDNGAESWFLVPLGTDLHTLEVLSGGGKQVVRATDWLVFTGTLFYSRTAEQFATDFEPLESA